MSAFGLRFLRKGTTLYDTAMGASVDANGYTSFPLRPTLAKRYFVGSGGSDANTGLSHAQRFATLGKAVSLMAAGVGNGDQVLIAEGTTLAETLPQGGDPYSWLAAFSGFSALYPTLFSSYDPADPLNEAKIGMGHQRGARPVLSLAVTNALGNGTWSYVAIKGINFNSGKSPDKLFSCLGTMTCILWENNLLPYTGLSFTDGGTGIATPIAQHIIIRNNSVYGVYTHTTNHVGNVYADGVNFLTYEDNVNYHSGWDDAVTRDTASSLGGPDVFRHPFYFQANCNNIVVRRNLNMDGAADAGIIRGDNVTCYENVSIRCPAGTGLGPGNTAEFAAYPLGCHMQVYHNLSLAAIDLNSTNPSGYGYTTANIASGSRVHHCLLIRSTATPATNDITFATTGDSAYTNTGRSTSMQFDNSVSFHWSATGTPGYAVAETGTPITNTYLNNIWDNVASGSNINWASTSFPNAYTEAALYAAAGVTDYATLVSLATNAPEQHYQRTLRSLAFAGYGITG